MAVRFVTGDAKGWLNVRFSDDNSTFPPLPQFLRVDYHGTDAGRDSLTVLEGLASGRHATVRRRDDGSSYLATGSPWLSSAEIFYAKSTGQLWYGRTGPVAVTTDPNNPQPNGRYDLELPYEVHPLGASYESLSAFAKTWFRVGHTGDRYLHPGSVSAGCTTVTDVGAWTTIYQYLIRARKGDGRSVGTLRVAMYPWERLVPQFVSDVIGAVVSTR